MAESLTQAAVLQTLCGLRRRVDGPAAAGSRHGPGGDKPEAESPAIATPSEGRTR